MRLLLPILLVALGGCAATSPKISVGPTALDDLDIAPTPVYVASSPVIREIESRVVPETPKNLIRSRSVYPDANVVEWTLSNGLTVIYHQATGAEGYHSSLTARAEEQNYSDIGTGGVQGESSRLSELLNHVRASFDQSSSRGADADGRGRAQAPPDASTLTLAGAVEWEWIEREIAVRLSQIRGGSGTRSVLDVSPRSITVDWDEWPAFLVARRILLQRVPGAAVTYNATAERANFEVETNFDSATALRAFGPASDADVRVVRSDVARDWSAPGRVVDALSTLYGLRGSFRPARSPVEAIEVGERVDRTPPSRVNEILSRFASTTDE